MRKNSVPPPFRRGRLRHIGPKPIPPPHPQQKEAPTQYLPPGGVAERSGSSNLNDCRWQSYNHFGGSAKPRRKRNAGGNLSKQETLRPPPGLQPGKKPDTCTTNQISARIPHPALRATFPPGEGQVRTASFYSGVRWGAERWGEAVICDGNFWTSCPIFLRRKRLWLPRKR